MSRHTEHKQAKQKLNEIAGKLDNCLVIHYSCESFYDIDDDRSPRITSIAIMDLQSGQVASFSIHKVAEILRRAINDELKTKSTVFEKYGATPQGVFDIVRNEWWAAALSYLATLFAGGAITKLFFS